MAAATFMMRCIQYPLMFEGRSVFVVVPAYNEEKLIGTVLDTMPALVDRIIVVDDASTDGTAAALEAMARHRRRAAARDPPRATTAAWARPSSPATRPPSRRRRDNALVVVMAGDAQMDPGDLPRLLAPLAARRGRLHQGQPPLHAARPGRSSRATATSGNAALSLR